MVNNCIVSALLGLDLIPNVRMLGYISEQTGDIGFWLRTWVLQA